MAQHKDDKDRPQTQYEKAGEHLMDRQTPPREGEPEPPRDRQREGDDEIDRAA